MAEDTTALSYDRVHGLYIDDQLLRGPFRSVTPELDCVQAPPPTHDPTRNAAWYQQRREWEGYVEYTERWRFFFSHIAANEPRSAMIAQLLTTSSCPVVTNETTYCEQLKLLADLKLVPLPFEDTARSVCAFLRTVNGLDPANPIRAWIDASGGLLLINNAEVVRVDAYGLRAGNDALTEVCARLFSLLARNIYVCSMCGQQNYLSDAWRVLETITHEAIRRHRVRLEQQFQNVAVVSPDGKTAITPKLIIAKADSPAVNHLYHVYTVDGPCPIKLLEENGHVNLRPSNDLNAIELLELIASEQARRWMLARDEQDWRPQLFTFGNRRQVYVLPTTTLLKRIAQEPHPSHNPDKYMPGGTPRLAFDIYPNMPVNHNSVNELAAKTGIPRDTV